MENCTYSYTHNVFPLIHLTLPCCFTPPDLRKYCPAWNAPLPTLPIPIPFTCLTFNNPSDLNLDVIFFRKSSLIIYSTAWVGPLPSYEHSLLDRVMVLAALHCNHLFGLLPLNYTVNAMRAITNSDFNTTVSLGSEYGNHKCSINICW